MNIFTEARADAVQLVSLPLEVVGLTLVLLELYFPRRGNQLEANLQLLGQQLRSDTAPLIQRQTEKFGSFVFNWVLFARPTPPKRTSEPNGAWRKGDSDLDCTVAMWAVAFALAGTCLYQVSIGTTCLSCWFDALFGAGLGAFLLFSFWGGPIVCALCGLVVEMTTLWPVVGTYHTLSFLNRFAFGRTIGGLGLMLAVMALSVSAIKLQRWFPPCETLWANKTMNAEPANTRFQNGRSTAPARLSLTLSSFANHIPAPRVSSGSTQRLAETWQT